MKKASYGHSGDSQQTSSHHPPDLPKGVEQQAARSSTPPLASQSTPPPVITSGDGVSLTLAPYNERGSSFIVDLLLMFYLTLTLSISWMLTTGTTPNVEFILWFNYCSMVLYRSLTDATGGTIGRAMYGIQLVDRNGRPPSFLILLLRNAIVCAPMIKTAFIFVYITWKRKSIVDVLFRHYVIKAAPQGQFRLAFYRKRWLRNLTISVLVLGLIFILVGLPALLAVHRPTLAGEHYHQTRTLYDQQSEGVANTQ